MTRKRSSELERFEALLSKQKDGCWIWAGCNRDKRAQSTPTFSVKRKAVQAPRWAYQNYIGPVPIGKLVYRSCGNLRCVAPEHLSLRPMRAPSTMTLAERMERKRNVYARHVARVNKACAKCGEPVKDKVRTVCRKCNLYGVAGKTKISKEQYLRNRYEAFRAAAAFQAKQRRSGAGMKR